MVELRTVTEEQTRRFSIGFRTWASRAAPAIEQARRRRPDACRAPDCRGPARTSRHVASTDSATLLEARDLSLWRGQRWLFRELDFELHAHELVHLTGSNGAGKTSLLRVLAGLLPADSGRVQIGGRRLVEVREQLAYLAHRDGITGALSPLENLLFWQRMQGLGAAPDAAEQALAECGLAAYIDTPCQALSAGQRRRVALARLALSKAPLWLLDEPYTNLDSAGLRWLDGVLLRHLEAGGAVMLTAHHSLALEYGPSRQMELRAPQRVAA